MTSVINIDRGWQTDRDALDTQLFSFLSNNTGRGYDIRVTEKDSISRSRTSLPEIRTAAEVLEAYPEVNFSTAMSINTSDTSITQSAALAIFLAKKNECAIELVINKIELVVHPDMTIAEVGESYLNAVQIDFEYIDAQSIAVFDNRHQHSGRILDFEDCIRNAFLIAELRDQPVKFQYHTFIDGTISEFVSKGDDFVDVYWRTDPRLSLEYRHATVLA